ncbi:MAG: hypothetical protein SVV67_05820 [Bacillota bacterium]|nr:hypothetical protein [Bacillota bacterium]
MAEKRKLKLTEDLIREALQVEFESIEAPPADRVWRRIESRLAEPGTSDGKRTILWSWAAAVVAACLVIAIGGFGIWRAMQPGASVADSVAPAESEEGVGIMETRDEDWESFGAPENRIAADSTAVLPFGEPDPDPPPWPSELQPGLVLQQAIVLTTAGEPHYKGALYCRGDTCLIWARSEEEGEPIDRFIDHLGGHILLPPGEREKANDMVHFTIDGRPALAWQEDGLKQALVGISGSPTPEELIEISEKEAR